MIVPMKKVAVVVQSKDAAGPVRALRALGVFHVEHQNAPKGSDITSLREDIAFIRNAITVLSSPQFAHYRMPQEDGEYVADWRDMARHIADLWKRLDQLEEFSRNVRSRAKEWERWGDFDPEALKDLRSKGIYIRLYEIPARELKNLPEGLIVKRVFIVSGTAGCVIISREKIDIPFKELELPKMGLAEMKGRLAEDVKAIQAVRGALVRHLPFLRSFVRIEKAFEKELEFHEAIRGMGESGQIVYLTGYVPHDAVSRLTDRARLEKWGIVVRDPAEEDNVPTLVRNPRWISIISPVFRLIEVVPGYHELDISLWFLLFLSVFFGMLVGDAGYGLIFLLLTFFFQKRSGGKVKDWSIFLLFYVFSACAVIWGVLTGTFFGQEWLGQRFKPLVPVLRDDKSLQAFCFLLGTVHLSIAHLWRAILKLPALTALADIGWVAILWGGFFLAKALILGDAFPPACKWFFIAGPALVVLFTNPIKNVFKGVAGGLGSLLLNIVNSFTDVVSYIRLFAVGLATVAIADSFNNMAMQVGFNSVLAGLVASLILVIGHGLNILLGPLSVLVHGVRLNVLEFCSHADIKWSGLAYRPLKEESAGKIS